MTDPAALPEQMSDEHADWLWSQLMDWCKAHGMAPAMHNALFAIVGRFRTRLRAAPQAPAVAEAARLREALNGIAAIKDYADEIEGELDKQTYDELRRAEFDMPEDADLSLMMTAGHYRKLTKVFAAIYKAAALTPTPPAVATPATEGPSEASSEAYAVMRALRNYFMAENGDQRSAAWDVAALELTRLAGRGRA